VAALTAAVASPRAEGSTGCFVVDVTDPDAHLVVEVGSSVHVHTGPAPDGALEVRGDAVELVEILSVRAPFTLDVPDDQRWMLRGLAQLFDVPLG
jgi:hypothetical protein